MVPLKHELRNGDRIEILTQPTQHPSRDWLEFAKTGRALSKIRHVIREDERERGRVLGREILENELKKRDQNLQKLSKSGELKEAAKRLNFVTRSALPRAHDRKRHCREGAEELIPEVVEEEQRAAESNVGMISQFMQRFRRAPRAHSPVLISGEEDLLVAYAQCCNPIPGEPVVGFVTRGRGITVHLATCPQLLAMEEERRIDVQWHQHKGKHTIEIRVVRRQRHARGHRASAGARCSISRMETQSTTTTRRYFNPVAVGCRAARSWCARSRRSRSDRRGRIGPRRAERRNPRGDLITEALPFARDGAGFRRSCELVMRIS
jgi:(p)ppGpp synthase/HD superfamily hydrolase